jgi:hypothetical protein
LGTKNGHDDAHQMKLSDHGRTEAKGFGNHPPPISAMPPSAMVLSPIEAGVKNEKYQLLVVSC